MRVGKKMKKGSLFSRILEEFTPAIFIVGWTVYILFIGLTMIVFQLPRDVRNTLLLVEAIIGIAFLIFNAVWLWIMGDKAPGLRRRRRE
jgi:hypothetical protein